MKSPSEVIQIILNHTKWSPHTALELSILSGLAMQDVTKIMSGTLAIDEAIAEKLDNALGWGKNYWLNLEKNYQIEGLKNEEAN